MILWIKEIALVGLKDWIWFVLILKRNEYHKSLDMMNWRYGKQYPVLQDLRRDIDRAHKINKDLSEVK